MQHPTINNFAEDVTFLKNNFAADVNFSEEITLRRINRPAYNRVNLILLTVVSNLNVNKGPVY